MTLDLIKQETATDQTLQDVIQCYKTNQWHKIRDTHTSLWSVRHEITVTPDNIVLKANCIVIPSSLQDQVIKLAHQGHQGVTKTKALLRSKTWFPMINQKTEEAVKKCLPCQASTTAHNREPLQMTELPDYPWQRVSVDFCGPFPSGHYILVVMDDYSRYPAIEILTSTSAKSTIPLLDKIFSEHGIPEVVKTDNGSPFQSEEFAKFATYLNFYHHRITPRWPEANGEVERFMRTIKKAVRTSQAEARPWRQELWKFVRSYRTTPHSSTTLAPAEALYARSLRTTLPQLTPKPVNREQLDNIIRRNDRKAKQYQKTYADNKRHVKYSDITVGDNVLVKSEETGKLVTPYKLLPYTVTSKKGSQVTVERAGHRMTRNVSQLKKVQTNGKSDAYGRDMNEEICENDVYMSEDEEDTNEIHVQVQDNNIHPRRNRRNRNPPTYLNDYIT